MRIKHLFVFLVVLALGSAVTVCSTARPAAALGFGVPTSVSSDANPSHIGQNVTFTATVTAPLAFGNVVFFDGATILHAVTVLTPNFDGTCPFCLPNGTSSASFSTSSLSSGAHSITAAAAGTPFGTSLSAPFTQTVQGATTSTTVTGVPAPPTVFGQRVTFTATVVANPSSVGTPTGSAQFTDNGADMGTQTLSDGSASVTTSNLSVGGHTIMAVYTSDNLNFLGSTGTWSQQVDMASTMTGITSNAAPSVFGQPITLTATVAAVAPGAGTPTGTVTFAEGTTSLDTAPVGGGQATVTTSRLSVGAHALTATYGGDGNFKSSTANMSQTVNQGPTSTTVSSSANPSVFGQKVTFTATVCPAPPSTAPSQPPSGTVAFTAESAPTPFDTETISGTSAPPGCESATSAPNGSFSVTTHAITVTYQGDANFLSSLGVLVGGQVVNKAPTAIALTTAPNPSFFGDGVILTATVAVPPPGAGIPTGTVTFADGTTVLATRPLAPTGQATFTTAGLQVGTHNLAASFSGDGNFLPSASTAVPQLVRCLTVVTGKVNGGLTVTGSTCVNNATINGGIVVRPGAALSLDSSTVNGGVSSSGAKAVTMCSSSIHGAGTVSATSGFVLIGDNGDDGFSCVGNDLRGNLTLTANAGQLELGGNQVHGGASISGTTGIGPSVENLVTEIEGNQVSGQLSCTNNTPSPTNDGSPNPSTGGNTGQCTGL
jgi:hypothetical protein